MKERSWLRVASLTDDCLDTTRRLAPSRSKPWRWPKCRGSVGNTVLPTSLAIGASLMLVLGAVLTWPYAYFSLLRVVVCGCAAYLAWLLFESERAGWGVALGGVALLFNPFLPVYLTRGIWQVIDVGVSGLMIASTFALHHSKGR